ncbi:extracellular catalytic domain type 1 short-chain-length polyhydroxyalkanoate depolymerase [Pararhizobium sp.]|uniref:extracellular catalytic domain type 1 short-chain-length polyhydroxyalkanoate depolymerase n=1 Tax=Pararhizobium sp. TaxID=1977563 RepID=UPI003D0EC753
MRSISYTIARLSKLRGSHGQTHVPDHVLADIGPFGADPGGLEALAHIPARLQPQSALVVVLHGCTQTASVYDHGSGWSRLADDYGFAVLFPQQTRSNNANTCFNWFVPGDTGRDRGEAASIRQMIEAAALRYNIDRSRIFITGLSAGGAMANVMLATYPEVFAGGAIIAGLPYGTATTIPEAFDRMRGHGTPDAKTLQSLLRNASVHKGPWPAISVWQGTRDVTVVPSNAGSIIDQWRGVHEVPQKADLIETVDGHIRQAWKSSDGRDVIEHYSINEMGHGTPIDPRSGYGKSAPYMLDVGISSTLRIARSWGLVASFDRRKEQDLHLDQPSPSISITTPASPSGPTNRIQKTIEDALRAAGLMK